LTRLVIVASLRYSRLGEQGGVSLSTMLAKPKCRLDTRAWVSPSRASVVDE